MLATCSNFSYMDDSLVTFLADMNDAIIVKQIFQGSNGLSGLMKCYDLALLIMASGILTEGPATPNVISFVCQY